jgi:outer membrane protein OmpA-like peptidoglycan-associated protein
MTYQSKKTSSRGKAPEAGSSSRGASPVAPGVPRFLTARGKMSVRPARDQQSELDAERAGARMREGDARMAPAVTPISKRPGADRLDGWLARQASAGERLPPEWSSAHDVRIHSGSRAGRIATSMGANAVTVGKDIFFAPGRYAPGTQGGDRLLAHELAHVAQQGGEPRALQCDLMQSMPVALGVFEIGMATQTTPPGLSGTIAFQPDPNGPYSAEIGLVQAVNATDVSGTTTPASGAPVDWRNMTDSNTGVQGTEAGRMEQMTPGTPGGAPAGWMIDNLPSATPRGDAGSPNYIEHFGIGGDNQYGWLRSPTDFGPASLFDFPSLSFDSDLDFETVAKGTDNQTVYGAISWGFQIRSGVVQNEYAAVKDSASAVFDEALERFRGYYVHEPVVLYFDTNQDIPMAGEEGKLADIPDYLDRYPDVTVGIEGNADVRGGEIANANLSQRRADAAHNLLLLAGVDATRIAYSFGFGETDIFSEHGTAPGARQPRDAGRLRANRRVVITFSHTVSNHPIVMP